MMNVHGLRQDACSAKSSRAQHMVRQAAAMLAAASVALTSVVVPAISPPEAHAVLNSPNAKIARSAEVRAYTACSCRYDFTLAKRGCLSRMWMW